MRARRNASRQPAHGRPGWLAVSTFPRCTASWMRWNPDRGTWMYRRLVAETRQAEQGRARPGPAMRRSWQDARPSAGRTADASGIGGAAGSDAVHGCTAAWLRRRARRSRAGLGLALRCGGRGRMPDPPQEGLPMLPGLEAQRDLMRYMDVPPPGCGDAPGGAGPGSAWPCDAEVVAGCPTLRRKDCRCFRDWRRSGI